jgi:hypothetical protein
LYITRNGLQSKLRYSLHPILFAANGGVSKSLVKFKAYSQDEWAFCLLRLEPHGGTWTLRFAFITATEIGHSLKKWAPGKLKGDRWDF